MKKYLTQFAALIMLLAVTLGCGAVNTIINQLDKNSPPKILTGTDGKTQISVPSSWKIDKELNTVADIQASNRIGEQYVVVISEAKDDFPEGIELSAVTKVVRDALGEQIQNGEMTEPVDVTINGNPAQQFEANGTVQNLKVKYLYAVVQTPENFHQVLTWTLQDRYEANKSNLQNVINSFQEIDPNRAPPIPQPSK